MPVGVRSKTLVCGRLIAMVAGSNPAEGLDISLVLCRYRPMRRADHSFRGVIVCVCVLIVCDLEISTMRRPKNELRFCASQEKRKLLSLNKLSAQNNRATFLLTFANS